MLGRHLEIFFDLACPFSFLAKLTIEQLEREARRATTISWSPLILHPSLPAEGIDFQSAHVGRYGERARVLQLEVERRAAEFGLKIDHRQIAKVPNTLEAHRAVRFARKARRDGEMIEALQRAYFTEYRDLTNREDLVAIVQAAGFDATRFRAYLDTDATRAEAWAAHERSLQRGARSVPSYRLDGIHIENTVDLIPALRGFSEGERSAHGERSRLRRQ